MFAWVKRLFGSDTPTPAPAAAAPVAKRSESERKEGAQRGSRQNDRTGERSADTGDRDGQRNGRGSRGGRGTRNTRGTPNGEGVEASGNSPQAERDENGPGNRPPRERGERSPRGERGGRSPRNGPRTEAGQDAGLASGNAQDAGGEGQRPHSEERTGARDEDGGQRRGNGRGQRRGPRRQDGDAPPDGQTTIPEALLAHNPAQTEAGADHQDATSGDGAGPDRERAENGEVRERRTRDRYGRDRNTRGDRPPRNAADMGETLMAMVPDAAPVSDTRSEVPAQAGAAEPVAAYATQASEHSPAAPASPARPSGMPALQPFALPLDTLEAVAQGAGLQWVNSNPDLVARAQAAIAATVPPVRQPRERPAPVPVSAEPLVLVETRRDLAHMHLAIEENTAPKTAP
jgi:ribonuclease E